MKKYTKLLSIILIINILLSACGSQNPNETNLSIDNSSTSIYSSGSVESHLDVDPDYDTVFPQDEVNEITIKLSPENWQAMLDDMTENYGEQGTGGRFQIGGAPGMPLQGEKPPLPGDGANRPAPGGVAGGGNIRESDENNPIWVEAEIAFESETWEHVGIRFKGNSSLNNTWSSGSLKLPFKLDFDQFEDEYPKTQNQRFFGFKQLSFASNFKDNSLLREKLAADIFRDAGVAAAETAFYAVSIDYGEGPIYLGLYTAVEVVDDTVIETQFSDGSGNVYKPKGNGASFAAGSFTETSFDKETNQEEENYNDILALYEILHSDRRLTDPADWRQALEMVFDVETFLNWLAVNTLIQNWDTYGVMHHNYYLYNNPETGQLVWIPWDNNESLGGSQGISRAITLDLDDVGAEWPLISYLRDDPVYYLQYLSYLESFISDIFTIEEMAERYQYYHDLISPYVLDENPEYTLIQSIEAFERSVNDLIQHTEERITSGESLLVEY
jgi:spore coat protein CotH